MYQNRLNLRSAKTADIVTEVENDDDSVDSGMPGLQTRHSDDTSSDDDSDYDKKPTKISTTMQWKVPIDDFDGEKFTCRRVRAQHTKRNTKRLHNRQKRAAIRKGILSSYNRPRSKTVKNSRRMRRNLVGISS
jgi:hypothetical protein